MSVSDVKMLKVISNEFPSVLYSLPIHAKNNLDAQEAFHTLLVEV